MPEAAYAFNSFPRTPGAWPSTCARSGELKLDELALVSGDDAREVHHLGESEHAASAKEALESPARSGRRGDSNRDAGMQDDAMK